MPALRIEQKRVSALRYHARVPRIALTSACLVLAALGLANLTAGAPQAGGPVGPSSVARDQAAEALAEGFARAYLTWDPSDPEAREQRLRAFGAIPEVAESASPEEGAVVTWSAVVATRGGGRRTLTTVALTTGAGVTFLAVTVSRDPNDRFVIDRPPAIVGAPSVAAAGVAPLEVEVDDRALRDVATRVVRNYLSLDREDLAADLDAGAPLTLPDRPLRVSEIGPTTWASKGRRVAVAATAAPPGVPELPLRYELSVIRRGGRWLVRSIHVNPTYKEDHP